MCDMTSCPKNCSENGKCTESGCECNPGWAGDDCSAKVCSNVCEPNGKCVNGACLCNPGFGGLNCKKQVMIFLYKGMS